MTNGLIMVVILIQLLSHAHTVWGSSSTRSLAVIVPAAIVVAGTALAFFAELAFFFFFLDGGF